MKYLMLSLCLSLLLVLNGCQSTAGNSRIIAGAFNLTTQLQQKLMDRDAPQQVRVLENIQYQQDPDLSLDVYLPAQTPDDTGLRPAVVWIHGGISASFRIKLKQNCFYRHCIRKFPSPDCCSADLKKTPHVEEFFYGSFRFTLDLHN